MNPEESFGRIIKARRRALDLTQEELARRVGCAAVTLRKIEADDLRPSQQIAERMAMALGIPLEERAAFVRQARAVTPKTGRFIEPTPTPMPRPEEIGQEDLSGRAIRGYALGERIGAGGMGAVYRAVQPLVEREVAIKIILPQFANHPDFIRRFEAEAQLVARLEHPHIVPLYDYWREPGVAYLVMRLLRGGSVRTLLESGALPLEAVARLLEQIGTALHAAHRVGVIHRDLKPANVLLDEDSNAYLADFGIAKNLGNPNMEDVTHADAIIGSPAYMSPEQIRSDTIRPQTDIYCLGVMLYELLTGNAPFHGPTPFDLIQQHLNVPLPPLAARRPGLPAALDTVIMRATAKDPAERYESVSELVTDFKAAISGSLSSQPIPTLIMDDQLLMIENPYKGLRAFGEGDAEDFFGRETLTQQLLARLAEGGDLARFLAVVGPSGSGKSSVVGAGLVPALRRGALPGSENWFIVELMPGPHPLEELEAALLRIAVNPVQTQHVASLLAQLKEDERGLLRAVRRCLPEDPNIELVLVIDQFEEVFTLVQDEAVRAHLLNSLLAAVLDERSRVRVIITLRADFTDRPLRYMDFGELMRQRSEFVLPLTPDELEHAIRNPATRVGLTLEPGLAAAIIHDVADQPGALPLLQYALTELFEKCIVETQHGASPQGNTLTKKAYTEIGGVLGALGRRAEDVFASLDADGQALARQLFLRLVTLGEGVEDTRRRVLRSELESLHNVMLSEAKHLGPGIETLRFAQSDSHAHTINAVVDAFGKSRLLAFDRDPVTRGPTVEVAHEALLREWPRLREWLSESRADVRLQRQLAHAAAEWQNANREASYLLTGAHLEQFEGWAGTTTVALTQDERAYLDASLAEGERKQAAEVVRQRRELELTRKSEAAQRTSANRLRYLVGALTIFLLVALGLTAFAFNQQSRAEEQARLSTSRELAAAAVNNISIDPERSVLLALQAVKTTHTLEAEDALHRTLPSLQPYFTLSGHTSGVTDITFSPDGSRVATASRDGTAKVWEAATGKALLTLGEAQAGNANASHGDHGGDAGNAEATNKRRDLYAIAYSPDGLLLATGGREAVVKLWDAGTGQELFTLGEVSETRTISVTTLRLERIGNVIIVARDVSETQAISITSISAVDFSPDGRRLAASHTDGLVRVWDLQTQQVLLTIINPLGGSELDSITFLNDVRFSPDGILLATIGPNNTARIWDATTGQLLLTLSGHTNIVVDLAFSPDGQRLATASIDNTAKVWDLEALTTGKSNQALLTLIGHLALVKGVSFSPDGQYLATVSEDGLAKMWDATTGQELFTLAGHTGSTEAVAFSPDGKHLVTGSTDTTARVWETAPGRELFTLVGHIGGLFGAILSPDGTRVGVNSFGKVSKVWDAASGRELLTLAGHTKDGIEGFAFSPDGRLIATGNADHTAIIWDAVTGQPLHTLTGHSKGVGGVAFTPDGTKLATSGYDKTVKFWDVATGQELFTLVGHTGGVHCLAISPDGTRLISGGDDSFAIVWDIASRQEVFRIPIQSHLVGQAIFSPDGTRIAIASVDPTARIYDAATGELLMSLTGHSGSLYGIGWSQDGSRFATGGADNIVKIWDDSTGQPLFSLYGVHIGGTGWPAFSLDGTRLFVGNGDGTVRGYTLRLEELVALAQSRVTRSLTVEECQQYLHVEACP